jgi:hypothetical protein
MVTKPIKPPDVSLADRLYPLYEANDGDLALVLASARAQGIRVGKAALSQMEKFLGWKSRLARPRKEKSGMESGQIQRPAPTQDKAGDLARLLEEATAQKDNALKILEAEPDSITAHKIYGQYIGHILKIREHLHTARMTDRDRLLIDVLKALLDYLMEQKQDEAVALVERDLESITGKIRDKWASGAI